MSTFYKKYHRYHDEFIYNGKHKTIKYEQLINYLTITLANKKTNYTPQHTQLILHQ